VCTFHGFGRTLVPERASTGQCPPATSRSLTLRYPVLKEPDESVWFPLRSIASTSQL
jgi:hypothetical protein